MFRILVLAAVILIGSSAQTMASNCRDSSWHIYTDAELVARDLKKTYEAAKITLRTALQTSSTEYNAEIAFTDCQVFGSNIRTMQFPVLSVSDRWSAKPNISRYLVYMTTAYARNSEALDLKRSVRKEACQIMTGVANTWYRSVDDTASNEVKMCMLTLAHEANDTYYAKWIARTFEPAVAQLHWPPIKDAPDANDFLRHVPFLTPKFFMKRSEPRDNF